MTDEQHDETATEALRKAVQDWLDACEGKRLVFGYCDAERVVQAVIRATEFQAVEV